MKKRLLGICIILSLIVNIMVIPASALTNEELSDKSNVQIGDCIELGHYLGEPIVWRCIGIDENGPLMLSDKVLCLKSYDAKGNSDTHYVPGTFSTIRKSYGSNCWADSNLREWLNSNEDSVSWSHDKPSVDNVYNGYNAYDNEAGFLTCFTDEELNYVSDTTQKVYTNEAEYIRGLTDGGTSEYWLTSGQHLEDLSLDFSEIYYQYVTDKFFVPNVIQLMQAYNNIGNDYIIAYPTSQAVNTSNFSHPEFSENMPCAYWINHPGTTGYSYEHMNTIGKDGNMSSTQEWNTDHGGAYISTVGVRPAFYLNTDGAYPENPGTDQPETSIGSVSFFSKWDSDTQQAYFDYSILAYSVTDNTEISPDQSIDQLVGKYVLVETNENNPLEILSIKSVDSKIGTVTNVIEGNGNPSVTALQFEDGTYAVVNGLIVSEDIIGKQVLYHLSSEEIVGYTELQEKTGTLQKWNNTTGEITIGDVNYTTNFLSALSQHIDNLVGKPVHILIDNQSGDIPTIFELSFEPGFYFSTNAVSNSLEVGMSSELYVNYYQEDGSTDPELNRFTFVVNNNNIIDVTPQDWNVKLGQHFTITAKKAGQSIITITNPQNNETTNIQFDVIEKKEGYTFANVPELVYEEGKVTNFYNHNGMVVDEFKYVPHSDINGNIDYYTVTMTVYNSLNLYGAVTAFNSDGVATDVAIIDRMTTMPSNFVGTVEDLVQETGDLFYLFNNKFYYSGKSISKQTNISIRVPSNGYLEISNSTSSSTAVLANFIGLLIDGSVAAIDIGSSADNLIKSKPTIIYKVLQTNFIEDSVTSAGINAAINQLKFPNWNNENYGDCIQLFVDQLSDYGIDLISMISDEIVSVTGILSITESVLMKVIPTGNLITFLYDVLGIGDQIVAWTTFQRSASFADGIYIYAPTSGNSYISSGVSVTPDSGIGADTITHVYLVTDDEEAGITNNTFPNEETYLNGSYETYNITMYKNGQETQPEGYVTVKIPLPDSFSTFDKNKIKVYRLNNDGTTTDMFAEVTGEYAIFRTDHFSYYSIVYEGAISENIPVKDILLNTQQLEFNQAGNIYQLVATVIPVDATNKAVTWVSSNPSVATVTDTGLVTAVSNGATIITVTTEDGCYTATCEVTVDLPDDPNIPVTNVEIDTQKIEFNDIGETYQLIATVLPIDATNQTVVWTSNNPEIVTVDASGKITAVKNGVATITATTQDGNYTASCEVLVNSDTSNGGAYHPEAGSSSSSSSDRYEITKPSDVENGSIKVSDSKAEKGDTVTITVTPDEGYELDELVVYDEDGDEIDLTDKGDGKFTFEMPKGDVEIEVSFAAIADEAPKADFADVAADAWYADAVQYVFENGMMSGTSETTFSPNLTTTRGMIVTILHRLENEPSVTGTTVFTDVAADQYYANAVAWAAQNGIVAGIDATTFAPNNAITREQMAAILYRYAQFKGYDVSAKADLSVYTDAASVGAYATDAMAWANGAELITGTSQATLSPTDQATRAQIAAILMRFCENVAK